MGEFEYKDYTPANARIIVDYRLKDEEKVKFSYPIKQTYKKAVWRGGFGAVMGFWFMLHYFLLLFGVLFIVLPYKIIEFVFWTEHTAPMAQTLITTSSKDILYATGVVLYFIGIPIIVTWLLSLDKERMAKYMPRLSYWIVKLYWLGKEMVFTPKDVKDKKIIIPSFNNVYLNYDTSGDFKKYLYRIEILEIPFKYRQRIFMLPMKKLIKNNNKFRAVFHFSKKPKTGELKIDFT